MECAHYKHTLLYRLCTVICFCVWIPHTALRLTTAIRADPYLPPWALGFAHVLLTFEGTMYAIAFSQVWCFVCVCTFLDAKSETYAFLY